MLRVHNLSKSYPKTGKEALVDASFEIAPGEIVGLIGPNGAGKSTLMKTLCKFIHPTSGSIQWKDQDLFSTPHALKDAGILIEPVFHDYLTAEENMRFSLELHKKEEYIPEIGAHLDLVGLGTQGKKYPKDFSFGMKQRLGLAMALIGKPKLLILDEPFVGLDPNGVDDLIQILKKRVQEDGICAMISSHQLYELQSLCKPTLVIYDGKIHFDGVPNHDPSYTFYVEKDRHVETVQTKKTGAELSAWIAKR